MSVSSPYDRQLGRIPARAASATVDGLETRYWEYGDPDAHDVIVMVHGFRGDHHGLEPIIAHLPGRRAIVPDLPGFGASAPLAVTHDLTGYARWLRGFLAAVAPGPDGRCVLLGHSFGSIVVAAALSESTGAGGPDDVILVNPIAAPALAGPRGVLTRLAVLYYRLGAALPEPGGRALLRNRLIVRVMSRAMAKTRDGALRRWIHDQHDRYFSAFADRDTVLQAFRASVSADVSRFAADIHRRTLLIAAERDDISPVAAQRRLAGLFPDARLVVLPDIGHLIHYEAPDAAAHAIAEFLDAAA